jgi:exonuclease III
MSHGLKRSLSSTERAVSPPATRRKFISTQDATRPGDQINKSLLRIFSWNVNGVSPLLQKQISFQDNSAFPLRAFLRSHQWPQFLCLQEVKINAQDQVTQRRLEQAANVGRSPDEPSYVARFSLPRDKYNAIGFGGKVYGVATLIRNDIYLNVQQTRKPDWDLEGRVLIHELSTGLVVINGYWVNGTINPYRNPETGAVEGTRHDHKLRFHQHMLAESQELQQEGKHVVLIGDMNVACGHMDGHPNLRISPIQHVKNRDDFNSKFLTSGQGLRGVDAFRELHVDLRKYSYYPRGCGWGQSCDRVDNTIVTRKLFESGAVTATGICDNPQDRGHSDHVPIWISIDTSKMPQSISHQ